MKKLNSILACLLLTASVFFTQQATAQAPQKMSYQSVLRNSSNVLLVNTAVGIKISVLQGSASGTAVYEETQTATTNANGLVSLQIGTGVNPTGTFAGIDWSAGPYFIKTETDPLGGTNYSITGTQEMLSVPFAMYAAKSGDATTMGTIGGSSSTNGGTITAGVLRLTPADATNGGVVTTGAQTFSGAKTFADDLKASQNIISGTPGWTTDGKIQSWNTNYNGRVLSVIGNNANYTGAAASFWNQGSGPSVAFDYAGSGQKIVSVQNQGNEVASVKKNGAINANSFVKTNGTSSQYLMADGSTSAVQVNTCDLCQAIAALQAQIATMQTQITSINNILTNQLAVGDIYQGGIIGYIFQSGDSGYVAGETHGLIAAQSDQGSGIIWSNPVSNEFIRTGATARVIGTGRSNTDLIIAIQGPISTSYAAGLARAYNGGGFTDWFLPSIEELQKLYINWSIIGLYGVYWSSTEDPSYNFLAKAVGLASGDDFKYMPYQVRAVRTF